MTPVSSVSTGTNADLIAEAVRLYAPPDAVIADVTYSTGRFWRKCPGRRVLASDLTPHPGLDHVCDFRALPYAGGS